MRARTLTAALVLGLGWVGPARAGEGTPAVIVHPGGACTACEVLPMASTRAKPYHENPLLKHRKPLPPMTVTLCPGACFGYFPTQWRSWEEACGPFPHGPGVTPLIPPASDVLPWKNGAAPDPRNGDPKKMKSMIAPLHGSGTRIN